MFNVTKWHFYAAAGVNPTSSELRKAKNLAWRLRRRKALWESFAANMPAAIYAAVSEVISGRNTPPPREVAEVSVLTDDSYSDLDITLDATLKYRRVRDRLMKNSNPLTRKQRNADYRMRQLRQHRHDLVANT